MAQAALWLQGFDHSREWHILVGECAQGDLPDAAYKISNGWIAGQVGPHDEDVGETADEICNIRVVTIGRWRADGDVILTAGTMQQ